MSVNETATQNLQRHHFLPPGGEGWCCGTNWPTEVVGIATLLEFDENHRFLTVFCGPYTSHTLKHFLHISPEKRHKGWFLRKPEKRYKGWFLRKLFELRIKLDKNAEGLAIFSNLFCLRFFEKFSFQIV
jgi:hypothetical protein